MKILLIQPPWYGFQNIISQRLYLGLAYLAAVLEKNNHEVAIFNGELFFDNLNNQNENLQIDGESYSKNFSPDHSVYKKILQAVKDFNPDIVGLSFMTANSNSAYILAKQLKEFNPNLPLIAGGTHSTLMPEEPLLKSVFDYVVRGEGEKTILELVETIAKKGKPDNILGLSLKQNNKIIHNSNRPMIENLDELPFPAFHLIKNSSKHVSSCKGIIASRGCPFECYYCASKLIWTRKVRFRSAKNVVEEIIDRHQRLGITSFAFHDDTFTLRNDFVQEFCKRVLELDFKISWNCDTRGDTLNFQLLKLMKKAGCKHIFLGLESGSPKIQKMIKKNLATEKVEVAVRSARRAGIETTVYFMVGFPEETEEDIQLSITAMKDIKPDHAIWSILTPYPGTAVWQIAKDQGLIDEKNINWQEFFHHYNRGSLFNSLPQNSWNKILKTIADEQNKIEKRLSLIKIKNKLTAIINLIKTGLNNPNQILNYFKKRVLK